MEPCTRAMDDRSLAVNIQANQMEREMRRIAIAMSFLVMTCLMTQVTESNAAAVTKKEEYKSPGSIMKLLLKEPLHGVKGEDITILHVAFPPGWVGGQHYHTGPVYVYVLNGTFVVHEKGKDPKTLSAGTLYREPIGNPMEAHNASTSEEADILVMQIGPKGEPLMVKTKF